VFQNFATASSFDLMNNGVQFLPANPGWVVVPIGTPTGCAEVLSYGMGCILEFASFYEEFAAAGAFDLANSAISLFDTGNGYVVTPGGSYNPVGSVGTPTTVPLTDDSQAMIGTLGLTVGSNGWVAFGSSNSTAFTPSTAILLSNPSTAFYCWHDYNPTAGGGTVQYEEAGPLAQITFDGVWDFGGTTAAAANFLQFQVDTATGNVVIAWQTMSANGNGFLVGYSPGGASLDPGNTDLSAITVIQTFATDIQPLTLAASSPRLGYTWNLTTTNIDPVSPFAVTFFGDGQVPIPGGLPLTTIGINSPGCSIWINQALGSLVGVSFGGTASVAFPIPSTPSLAAAVVTGQSLGFSLAVPSNLLTSNGVQGTLGN
jgi:hypothetical protein